MRPVPGYDLPTPLPSDIDFGETPVVLKHSWRRVTNALELSGDDRSIAIDFHAQVRSFVAMKSHSAGSDDDERLSLVDHWHVRHRHDEVVGPKVVESIGIAAQVCIVPDVFEPGEFLEASLFTKLRRWSPSSDEHGDANCGEKY